MMKKTFFFLVPLVIIVSLSTGWLFGAEGMKNQAMIQTSINNFKKAPLEFFQIGLLQSNSKLPEGVSIGFNLAAIPHENILVNTIDQCLFHSVDSVDPVCVICELFDDAGNKIAEGSIIDLQKQQFPDGYIGSTQLKIDLKPTFVDEIGKPSNDVKHSHKVKLQICQPGQGCTPGFWKTHSELGPASFNAWPTTSFKTNDKFKAVFGINPANFEIKVDKMIKTDPTLIQALNAKGGGINALARHATAALLSSSSNLVGYSLTLSEVIDKVQTVDFDDSESIESAKNLFAGFNELNCPIGATSEGVEMNDGFAEIDESSEEEADGEENNKPAKDKEKGSGKK